MGKGPKTKKSMLKRFKVTGTGKVMAMKNAGRSHLMGSKSRKKETPVEEPAGAGEDRHEVDQKHDAHLREKENGTY